MITIDSTDITDVKIGNIQVTEVYAGSHLVWQYNPYKDYVPVVDGASSCKINGTTYNLTKGDNDYYYLNKSALSASITSLSHMFSDSDVTKIIHWGIDTSTVTNMEFIFNACGLTDFSFLSILDTSKTTTFEDAFRWCRVTDTTPYNNYLDFSSAENIKDCFNGTYCTSIDLSKLRTPYVTNAQYCFAENSQLQTLDISGWNLENASLDGRFGDIFNDCYNLTTIYMRGCNQSTIDKINSFKPSNATIVTE